MLCMQDFGMLSVGYDSLPAYPACSRQPGTSWTTGRITVCLEPPVQPPHHHRLLLHVREE